MIRVLATAAALSLPLTGLVSGVQAQDADRFKDVVIETETAGAGVEVLYGAGGNLALAYGTGANGEAEAFLVDDQFAPLTDRIMAKVQEIAGTDVKFLVNTHWHFDHSGGNENFGKAGAVIVAHDNVRQRMAKDGTAGGREVKASPPIALPTLTFRDRQTINSAGMTIRAIHVHHAHTDGDALVHFVEPNVIHMGDTFFSRTTNSFPFIDTNSGGSIQGAITAAETGLKLADAETAIIPGHGKLTNRAELAEYRDMLVDIRDRVQVLIDSGEDRDAVIAAKPAEAYAAARAEGFIDADRFVGTVYDGLTNFGAHTHENGERHVR
ncbi:MAG: MBL fold metallo-hydrolase [Pseudomonadota bacterium]